MSSSTAYLTLQKVEGSQLTIRVIPAEMGGAELSRSFFFNVFTQGDFLGGELYSTFSEPDAYDDWTDEEWLKENLDKYIVRTQLLEVSNWERIAGDYSQDVLDALEEAEEKYARESKEREDARAQVLPNYTVLVELAAGIGTDDLEVGTCGDTVAYDVWYDDPKSDRFTR
jgi:hypothetical protein